MTMKTVAGPVVAEKKSAAETIKVESLSLSLGAAVPLPDYTYTFRASRYLYGEGHRFGLRGIHALLPV